MDRIKGLDNLIRSPEYRQGMCLPPEVTEEYILLAQGEYNVNYSFTHPVSGRKLLLRVNCGSQMHLKDQIGYEYRALKMLQKSGRTPEVFYVDGSEKYLDHGVLVMEELPGHALDYRTELGFAAEILADIHSMRVPSGTLICPEDPLKSILDECEQMFAKYMDSPLGDTCKKQIIRELLDRAWNLKKDSGSSSCSSPYKCCINTELNSTNFLINGKGKGNYLIDWEKPLYGDPAQDLGHFLAPTTTFWKTDVILSRDEMDAFVEEYIKCAAGRFDTSGIAERTKLFTTITCLRGITWCAMAWVEYHIPGRTLSNESTAKKLDQYLDREYLGMIGAILDNE